MLTAAQLAINDLATHIPAAKVAAASESLIETIRDMPPESRQAFLDGIKMMHAIAFDNAVSDNERLINAAALTVAAYRLDPMG